MISANVRLDPMGNMEVLIKNKGKGKVVPLLNYVSCHEVISCTKLSTIT